MSQLFETLPVQAEQLHARTSTVARQLRDFVRRLELILTQNHKHIPVRDIGFGTDFATFCKDLRQQTDQDVTTWQQLREHARQHFAQHQYPLSLQAKSFAMRAKTLSRTCDDLTTVYDQFNSLYKNYTLSKLPVWVLTACCEDINHLVDKILFLARENTKYAERNTGENN